MWGEMTVNEIFIFIAKDEHITDVDDLDIICPHNLKMESCLGLEIFDRDRNPVPVCISKTVF